MIDTDKYEGHTEGEWKLHYDDSAVDGDYLDYGAQLDPVGALHPMSIADAQLMADAPLLLEEVKRLRKELNHTKVTIDEWDNKGGPCVTVYLEGCEYVGMLRLYKDENGKVIE